MRLITEEVPRKTLSVEALDGWLKSLEIEHSLLVLDSCFNGSLFVQQGSLPDRKPKDLPGRSLNYLVAGDALQCHEGPPMLADAFLEVLLDRRSDRDKDGLLRASEASARAQRLVMERSFGLQVPRSGRSSDREHAVGDVVLREFASPSEGSK